MTKIGWVQFEAHGRDQLIEDLHNGRIDPDSADWEARRQGWTPIIQELDESQYDPVTQRDWTFAMVAEWLAWRCVERVRFAMPEYRQAKLTWRKKRVALPPLADGKRRLLDGWWEEREFQSDAPLMMARFEDSDPSPGRLMTIASAMDAVTDRLRSGEWEAITIYQGDIHPIKPLEWALLTHTSTARERDAWSIRGEEWKGPKYDSDLTISRDLVLRAYPPPAVTVMTEVGPLFSAQDSLVAVIGDFARAAFVAVQADRDACRLDWPGYYKFAHQYVTEVEQSLALAERTKVNVARKLVSLAGRVCRNAPELNLESMKRELRNVVRDSEQPGGDQGGAIAEMLRGD